MYALGGGTGKDRDGGRERETGRETDSGMDAVCHKHCVCLEGQTEKKERKKGKGHIAATPTATCWPARMVITNVGRGKVVVEVRGHVVPCSRRR